MESLELSHWCTGPHDPVLRQQPCVQGGGYFSSMTGGVCPAWTIPTKVKLMVLCLMAGCHTRLLAVCVSVCSELLQVTCYTAAHSVWSFALIRQISFKPLNLSIFHGTSYSIPHLIVYIQVLVLHWKKNNSFKTGQNWSVVARSRWPQTGYESIAWLPHLSLLPGHTSQAADG